MNQIQKVSKFICCFIILGVISLCSTSYAQPQKFNYKGDTVRIANKISFSLRSNAVEIKKEKSGEETVQMKGFSLNTDPGNPVLPVKTVNIALPPNVDWKSCRLILVPKTHAITGTHVIKPSPPFRARVGKEELYNWGNDKDIVDNRNMRVYRQKSFYPENSVRIVSQSQMRKWKFVSLEFCPVQFNPSTKKLQVVDEINVTIEFKQIGQKVFQTDPILKDTLMDAEAKEKFMNFKDAVKWYKYVPTGKNDISQPDPDYVIITTNAIVAGSGATLTAFVNHLTSLGHSVLVVTETDYGALVGQAPNGTAEKIRQWLINNYIALGIKWVLLIGNPDPADPTVGGDTAGDVPMKMCWPNRLSTGYRESPTDYFYANLTGNWDLDGDGYFGESTNIATSDSPDPLIDHNSFSVRWTGQIQIDADGTYGFAINNEEGVRLQIDGSNVIENWVAHSLTYNTGSKILTAGQHNISIEFFNVTREAIIQFNWLTPGATGYALVPDTKLFHLSGGVFVSGGLDGQYFNNSDFTAPALTRVDPMIYFNWAKGDSGPGGVDFTPDVYVGRIPVYGGDYATLNTILQKIMNYQTANPIPLWRRNMLFGAVYLWDPQSDCYLGEALVKDFTNPLGFGNWRAYESDFGIVPPPNCTAINPPNTNPAAPCNMLQQLVNGSGYGVVGWSTHGWDSGASGLITSADCASLNDLQPFFAFEGSCLNGYPELSTNLGYSLLKHGAIGTVSASRVSWNGCYDPTWAPPPMISLNCTMNYYYFKSLLNGLPAGQSLYKAKGDAGVSGVWMNNTDYNLYGEPANTLLSPYSASHVDVVLVLDHSGSMSGYSSASMTDQKYEVLKSAADQFVDMMDAGGSHKLGIVKFTTTATTILPLQIHNAGNVAAAHAQIATITPSATTSIGDGLTKANAQFDLVGVDGSRRVVLLVTDGMENTAPMIAAVQPNVIARNIKVFPVGLGYSTGVDEDRLINLANATGGDYRITDDDLVLKKYFIEVLSSAINWSVVTDPIYTLAGGKKDSIAVPISMADTSGIFTVYWSNYDNAVKFHLRSPAGVIYSSSSSSYTGKPRYAFFRIKLSKIANRAGNWWMVFEGNASVLKSNSVRLSATALVSSGLHAGAGLSNGIVAAGNKVIISTQLNDAFGKPITGAHVKAYINKPLKSLGTILHDNVVDPKLLRLEKGTGDSVNLLSLKTEYLMKKIGKNFLPLQKMAVDLYDDGKHNDGARNDGIYAAVFNDTKNAGTYSLRFVAAGIPSGRGVTVSREWTKVLKVNPNIEPKVSMLEVKQLEKINDVIKFNLIIEPKDSYGNYLGSGHSVKAVIDGVKDRMQLTLVDNLDGIYSTVVSIPSSQIGKQPVKAIINIDDKKFTELEMLK